MFWLSPVKKKLYRTVGNRVRVDARYRLCNTQGNAEVLADAYLRESIGVTIFQCAYVWANTGAQTYVS